MLFIISKHDGEEEDTGMDDTLDAFSWTLYKVVKGEPTKAVARSVEFFGSEADARSDIATAKIALKAARFARVRADV